MQKPRFDFIYFLVVIAVILLIIQYESLTTGTLITYLAFFDIVVGFALIIKGFLKWEMSYIITGAICALLAYYAWKDMSDTSLIFLILGGLVGVGNHVRKTFKNFLG